MFSTTLTPLALDIFHRFTLASVVFLFKTSCFKFGEVAARPPQGEEGAQQQNYACKHGAGMVPCMRAPLSLSPSGSRIFFVIVIINVSYRYNLFVCLERH